MLKTLVHIACYDRQYQSTVRRFNSRKQLFVRAFIESPKQFRDFEQVATQWNMIQKATKSESMRAFSFVHISSFASYALAVTHRNSSSRWVELKNNKNFKYEKVVEQKQPDASHISIRFQSFYIYFGELATLMSCVTRGKPWGRMLKCVFEGFDGI